MSDYNYYYYELSKALVSEAETLLLRAHRSDIRLVSGGSKFQPLSVTSHAKKISTSGFLLTADEKVKLEKNPKLMSVVGEDRAHVITTVDELILLLEQELGESLQTPKQVAPTVESIPQAVKDEVHAIASANSSQPTPFVNKYGASPVVFQQDVQPQVSATTVEVRQETLPPVVETNEQGVSSSVTLPSEDLPNPYDDDFGLTLEDEVSVLRADNEVLRSEVARLRSSASEGNSELTNQLTQQLTEVQTALELEKQAHEKTKETLDLVDEDFRNKKSSYASLEVKYQNAKDQLKELSVAPVSPLTVPKNVEIYVTASSLDLAPSYQYLLVNLKDTLVIDLSPESLMDTLVRITKRNRVAKWLLGEQNIRSLYSPYDEIKLRVASGLELLTSPNALLPVGFLAEVDWERKFEDLARLNSKVVIYLGLETNRGVSEFLSRLDKNAKVLRSSSPLSERAWSRIVRQHEGAVEEVSI